MKVPLVLKANEDCLVLRLTLVKRVRKVLLNPPVNELWLAPMVRRATRVLLVLLVLRVSKAFWVELVPLVWLGLLVPLD